MKKIRQINEPKFLLFFMQIVVLTVLIIYAILSKTWNMKK